ncbi:DUF421 domain-containing protein [Halalkalibacillus sediminis]|uniref:DUF421 domain-containing protein n=1 Tax=Halalkalibacillus sediminis TaxID=2018042 RepID=A0A2I0QYE3_9BACI|nr:DUF421 domain-containing protein [Halalkalibacillus sediminis]PKR79354.1 DUF421 domain-containing protein [Halalkalibacillus sediminis]
MDFMKITVDSLVGFSALFVLTKVLGKSQITQISAFDFIAALVLGELVGNALFDPEVGISMILYAIALWGVLLYVIEWLTQKFRRTRTTLEGKPSLVIRRGKIQKDVMTKCKLDINQLMHLLRDKDVFSLKEVEYAVFETNGAISVLKKFNYQSPTNEQFNLPPQTTNLPITMISDGEIIYENLKEVELTEEEIKAELETQGLLVEDVMYAEWDKESGMFVMGY